MIRSQDEVSPVPPSESKVQAELIDQSTNFGAFGERPEEYSTSDDASLRREAAFSAEKLLGDQHLQAANNPTHIETGGNSAIDVDPFAGMFVEIPVLMDMQQLMMTDDKRTSVDNASHSSSVPASIIKETSHPEVLDRSNLIKNSAGDDLVNGQVDVLKALFPVNAQSLLPVVVDKNDGKDCDIAILRHDESQLELQQRGQTGITRTSISHTDQVRLPMKPSSDSGHYVV